MSIKSIAGDNNCSICLNELKDNLTKLSCSHIFHTSCIENWKNYQQNCPYCRASFNNDIPILPKCYFDDIIQDDGPIELLTLENFRHFYHLLPCALDDSRILELIPQIKAAKILKNSLVIFREYNISGPGVLNSQYSKGLLTKIIQINCLGTFACEFQTKAGVQYYHSNLNRFLLCDE